MWRFPFLFATIFMMVTPGDSDLDVITLNGKDCGLEGTLGGSEGQKDLNRHKNRYESPDDSDIDPAVAVHFPAAVEQEKAARIAGFVIDVKSGGSESCNCGAVNPDERDTHIELCLAANAPETQRVIVEVTPRLRILKKKAGIDWTTSALEQQIKGKWIEVTGWLLFDTAHIKQAENTNPGDKGNWRSTCWEIHPVTDMKILESAPAEAAGFKQEALSAMHRLHAAHLQRAPNGKVALAKLHKEYLSKFHKKEIAEAEAEAEERRPHP